MTYLIDPDGLGYGMRVMYGVNLDPPTYPSPMVDLFPTTQKLMRGWIVKEQVTIDKVENGYTVVGTDGKKYVCESFDSLVNRLALLFENKENG